jgi:hypothetical protein
MQYLALLAFLSLMSACGKSNSHAGLPVVKKILSSNGPNIQGLYTASFFPVNSTVVEVVPSSAPIQRKNDKLYAYVKMTAGSPNGWHQQDIHEGTRCPTLADDTNADGVIDYQEGEAVLGNQKADF